MTPRAPPHKIVATRVVSIGCFKYYPDCPNIRSNQDLGLFDPRARASSSQQARSIPQSRRQKLPQGRRMVSASASNFSGLHSRDAKEKAFGERKKLKETHTQRRSRVPSGPTGNGQLEATWVPSGLNDTDQPSQKRQKQMSRKDHGGSMRMEFGSAPRENVNEANRKGRTHRRTNVRSGSRNVFRRL